MAVTLPVKTGGPAYPPFPSDATKYGLSILGYFAAHAMTGLCANPEVVNQAFIETVLAPDPEPRILPAQLSSAAAQGDPMALGVLEFTFNNNTIEPVGASNVQLDNGNQTSATKMWINKTTSDGIDANKPLTAINSLYGIYMQDKDDASRNMSYNVLDKAIDKGVYIELPVAFINGGAPLPEQRILLTVYKLVAVSELTPELLAKIAYTIAAEMVEVRDLIPIEPQPVPSGEEPAPSPDIAPPLPVKSEHQTIVRLSAGAPQ